MMEELRVAEKHVGLLAQTVLVNGKRYCSLLNQSMDCCG